MPALDAKLAELGLRRARPVGREHENRILFHRRYEGDIVAAGHLSRKLLGNAHAALRSVFPRIWHEYCATRIDTRTSNLSFLCSPDFDQADEPTVGEWVLVRPDGSMRKDPQYPDPFIWQHKWMMVKDAYPGFDVAASKRRSLAWLPRVSVGERAISRREAWLALCGRWEAEAAQQVSGLRDRLAHG